MLVRLAGKLLWGTTKFTVKHIVVPIVTTMIIAAVATELADRMRANTEADADGDGRAEEDPAWHAQP